MARREKTREITIVERGGAFTTFFKKLSSETKGYDFEGLAALRQLLSNERAKIIHIIKHEKPHSIYEVAKKTGRDIKAVTHDLRLLARFGLIDLVAERVGHRHRLKPILTTDTLLITLQF